MANRSISIERKKLFAATALLIVVAGGISSLATREIVREGVASRIQREAIDINFDNARCESVALATARNNIGTELAN